MSYLLCGSKPYQNINFIKLIDNNFDNIIRFNMNVPNCDSIYGNINSTVQVLNTHVLEHYIQKADLNKWLKDYHMLDKQQIINFFNYINNNSISIKFIGCSIKCNNNKDKINLLLKKILSNNLFTNGKIPRCGLGFIADIYDKKIVPFLIGYGIYEEDSDKSYYLQANKIGDCHNATLEKKILIDFHNNNIVDATLSCIEDKILPTLNCKYIKPKIQSVIYILKTYGICILKNYYSQEILDNLIKEYHKIFEEQQSKIEVLDKEECSNDERIFHAQKYSEHIKQYFSDDKLFNSIAVEYTKHKLNKKTLINKVVYEEGKIKNSGAGWHRDNHDCQFKVLMYLSDVNEKNGPFQFITNSSKKYVGYPPPRTKSYNTRFHDKTIEDLIEKNVNCNLHDVIGEKGTIAIVDTTYIHRGKIIEQGERYAITEYFI
uniref:Phytanoyl-CoA dioxygenase n=1 Tax=viral metagenome TaxID=1070528 RepID=A0A6C0AWP2_9ZZZZ|tara:strand:+ start:27732 stop:29024 length:1293 start_codon:yes stop_codon:yes gene_type:complete